MAEKFFVNPENQESGVLTQALDAAETSVAYVSPVPSQAPGYITINPNTDEQEEIYYESKDAGAGTINSLTRDTNNDNGGSGRDHQSNDPWETLQSATYIKKIVEGLLKTLDNTTGRFKNETGYAAGGGTANAHTVTLNPAPSAYAAGMIVSFKAGNANTGASTVNVNSLGAKSIKKNVSDALEADDIKANQVITLIYDGTNFQMLSGSGGSGSSATRIFLSPLSAVFPASNYPQLVKNAGTNKTDFTLDYDASTNEIAEWQIPIPSGITFITATLYLFYRMASATANEVLWEAVHSPIAEGEAWDAAGTTDTFTADTVPGTAGQVGVVSKALTITAWAAGEVINLKIRRDAADANDDATGDAKLMGALLVLE